jgi:hypothetical protein
VRDDHHQTEPVGDVRTTNRGVEGSPARQSVAFHLIAKFVLLFHANLGRHGIKLDVNTRIEWPYFGLTVRIHAEAVLLDDHRYWFQETICDSEGPVDFSMTVLTDDGRNPLGMKHGRNQEQQEDIDVPSEISRHFAKKERWRFPPNMPLQSSVVG